MPITTLLFDLDDTLLIEHDSVRGALQAAANLAVDRHGVDVETVITRAREHAVSVWWASPLHGLCHELGISAMEGLCSSVPGWHADLNRLQTWLPTFQHEVWRQTLRDFEIADPGLTTTLASAYYKHRRRYHAIIPEAESVLAKLAAHYKIGLVTNGPADLQRDKLAHTGLGRYFHAVAISGDRRMGKPGAEIFSFVLDQLGSSPAESLMIGDNPLRDVLGALRAGVRPIWINPTGRALPEHEEICPVPTIQSIRDLPSLLRDR